MHTKIFVAAACWIAASACAQPSYAVTALTPAGSAVTDAAIKFGIVSAAATGLNNLGAVVGWTHDIRYPRSRATIWSNGQAVDLGDLDWLSGAFNTQSNALAINDKGQVLMSVQGDHFAVGGMGGIASYQTGYAAALNNAGIVGGTSVVSGHATLWSNGAEIALGTLGGRWSGVNALSNSGYAGGSSTLLGDATYQCMPFEGAARCTVSHAVVWANDRMVDLGAMDGAASWVSSINDAGHAVGTIQLDKGLGTRAFYWDGDQMKNLGYGRASSINNFGQVVGSQSSGFGSASSPTLWVDGQPSNLNSLLTADATSAGWRISEAVAINDMGQIVASAYNWQTSLSSAVLLSPVDELPEAPLFALGLAVLVTLGRRNGIQPGKAGH